MSQGMAGRVKSREKLQFCASAKPFPARPCLLLQAAGTWGHWDGVCWGCVVFFVMVPWTLSFSPPV